MPMRRKYKGKRRYKKAPSFKVLRLLEGLAQGKTQKQAALDAGFSSKNPSQSAYQALAVIREHMPELMDRCGLTAGALIEKYLLPDATQIKVFAHRGKHRLKTLVLLMRYSGMRISDAVTLNTDRLDSKKLFLYTQKTEVPVYTVLPDSVLKALEATPRTTEKNYFWSGECHRESVAGLWEKRLKTLFESAGVSKGEGNAISHRFRDTFAVELLLAGVPIERVSILLGHQSVRVTERHYNPWVRSRQEQLEADVARTWKLDPVLSQKNFGTNQVHLVKGPVN